MKTANFLHNHHVQLMRLYPTFKEWKRVVGKMTYPGFYVYILPLRNENYTDKSAFVSSSTRLYPTFKEWKLLRVNVWV